MLVNALIGIALVVAVIGLPALAMWWYNGGRLDIDVPDPYGTETRRAERERQRRGGR